MEPSPLEIPAAVIVLRRLLRPLVLSWDLLLRGTVRVCGAEPPIPTDSATILCGRDATTALARLLDAFRTMDAPLEPPRSSVDPSASSTTPSVTDGCLLMLEP